MDGVQVLRARVEALSSEITFQKEKFKELLEKLERDRSLTQQQLNSFLDPVSRLPLEISSDIFLRTLPSTPEPPNAHDVPMLLLNICHAWTDIALSISALWAAICTVLPCTEESDEGLQAWLQRAGNRPLSVSLRGEMHGRHVPAFILEHGRQFRYLEICDDQFSTPQILQLLGSAPDLTECSFRDMRSVAEHKIKKTTPKLVLPTLCRMVFGETAEQPGGDPCILKFLTLPAVQTLHVPLCNDFWDGFLCLLRRSSPPMKKLVLGGMFSVASDAFRECLHLIPTLECFELWGSGPRLMSELFPTLASPSQVPDLHTLRIVNVFTSYYVPDSWDTLLRVLSSRPKLRIVHVSLRQAKGFRNFSIPANILAAFKDLVRHGVQIYIAGSGDRNLVDVEGDSSGQVT
ncbi:hypothetical protein DFH06DRAFT_1314649 [Mycena polygramma]|nr:hypothetical protein DFH06DRAFT_1314649 [Mycena polygramma]